ncbi:hypothetical protein EVAR_51419_1 [Eumeta japonica]|uniref:Uncharacterized protein n=1 Tax=Eumeta variegata TaxID=151549 RepID=A0A4C1XUX6_EUMVA|nr:hypothetical protein EVAR_51419_1 [Eumeta japonica]
MLANTCQKAKLKHRDCIWLERAFQKKSNDTKETPYDRVKQCRKRKRMNAAEQVNDGASTSAAGVVEIMQVDEGIASTSRLDYVSINCVRSLIMKTHWAATSARFNTTFVNNPFGYV